MLNKIYDLLKRFDSFHYSIRKGKTGCANKLAEKTNMSRRTFFETLEALREQGIPIEYSKDADSYEFNGEVKYNFEVIVDGKKIIYIKGGKKSFIENL